MANLNNREEIKRKTDEDPDVERLRDAFLEINGDLGSYYNQVEINYNTRNCLWPNQDLRTGRKHGTPNKPAYPWEDASDIRPFTTNSLIDENVSMFSKALLRGNLTAIPIEGNDIERSRMISEYMKYLINSIPDLPRQAKILANYQEEKAIGVLGVAWDTKVEDQMNELTIEQVAQFQMPEDPEVGLKIVALITDPEQTKEATDAMSMFFPNTNRRKARKAVNELRKEGVTKIAVPTVIHNRPAVKALAVGEDIVFPPNVINLQDSPYIFHSEYMTPEQLLSKVEEDGWDEEWVNEVITKTMGQSNEYHTSTQTLNAVQNNSGTGEGTVDDASGFVRITHGYEKALTEDGVIGVFVTAFHPEVSGWGMSGLLDYKPSRYPFVAFPREYRSDRLMDTRGVPELGKGAQDEIKVQQDSRVDRTAMTTCPTREHPLGRKPTNFGPGDSVGVRRRGEYGFMETPSGSIQESIEIEQSVRDNLNRSFGRPVAGEDPNHAVDILQDQVNQWMQNWVIVMDQIWDLDQQFGDDEKFFRVIGSRDVEAMQFIRSEGTERVDFYFDYNLLNADTSKQVENLVKLGELASAYDREGTFDFAEFMRATAGAMDTSYSDRFIKPAQQATEDERRKTQDDIAKMVSGQVVNAPENANTQLRQAEIQAWMQGTEEIPAQDVQAMLQNSPEAQARIQKYMEQLQFQETQRQNALIGRLGTQPGNSLPSA